MCATAVGLLCASYSARKGHNMDAKKAATQGGWTTDESFDDKLREARVTSALLTAGSLERREVPEAQELLKAPARTSGSLSPSSAEVDKGDRWGLASPRTQR